MEFMKFLFASIIGASGAIVATIIQVKSSKKKEIMTRIYETKKSLYFDFWKNAALGFNKEKTIKVFHFLSCPGKTTHPNRNGLAATLYFSATRGPQLPLPKPLKA